MLRKNSLVNYNPFNDIEEMEKHFFADPFEMFGTRSMGGLKTDIKDEGDKYILAADMPGFNKEDIKLDIDADVLTVSAERHSEHEEKDKMGKYIRCERSYGQYSRSFDLSGVNTDNISAKYENGVLTLELPKKTEKETARRRLEIQ